MGAAVNSGAACAGVGDMGTYGCRGAGHGVLREALVENFVHAEGGLRGFGSVLAIDGPPDHLIIL